MGRLVPLRFLFWGTGENKVTNRNQNSLVLIGEAFGGIMDGPVTAIRRASPHSPPQNQPLAAFFGFGEGSSTLKLFLGHLGGFKDIFAAIWEVP